MLYSHNLYSHNVSCKHAPEAACYYSWSAMCHVVHLVKESRQAAHSVPVRTVVYLLQGRLQCLVRAAGAWAALLKAAAAFVM
jgi:hypothetical protein